MEQTFSLFCKSHNYGICFVVFIFFHCEGRANKVPISQTAKERMELAARNQCFSSRFPIDCLKRRNKYGSSERTG